MTVSGEPENGKMAGVQVGWRRRLNEVYFSGIFTLYTSQQLTNACNNIVNVNGSVSESRSQR